MRLALVQMPNYGSIDANLCKSLRAVETAAKQEALQIRNAKPYTQLRRTEFYL